MNKTTITVKMCQVKTGRGDTELNTILGSCVGIGLIWKRRGICGLAHCLLSKSPNENYALGAHYVDQAFYSLEQMMSITDYRDIRAVIAGGGNMTMEDTQKPERLVGHINTEAAISELEKRNIIITHRDIGGNTGRRVTIDCLTGEATIQPIPRIGQQ